MVDAIVAAVRHARAERGTAATTHFFVAAPNALTFFLGQRHRALGRVALHEFDFDGAGNRSHTRSLTFLV